MFGGLSMKGKWRYIIIAVVIILAAMLIFGMKTGLGTQQGKFYFLKQDETETVFIYSPD